MKILKLAIAAAIAASGFAAAPAAADQRNRDRMEQRENVREARRDVREAHRDLRDARRDLRRDRTRGHRGRYGYNSSLNRGRHYGWSRGRQRVCTWTWRNNHRRRVCRWRR